MKKWQLNFRKSTLVFIGAALSSISVYADERSVSTTLEEVIVTAQKRQELAQDSHATCAILRVLRLTL
jgi:hypothetical protein